MDEGYILFKDDEENKVRKSMSILLTDPINNKEYNIKFSSTYSDNQEFKLSTKLESKKFKNMYGEDYEFMYNKKLCRNLEYLTL